MPSPSRPRVGALVVLAAVALLAGCAGQPVAISTPSPSAASGPTRAEIDETLDAELADASPQCAPSADALADAPVERPAGPLSSELITRISAAADQAFEQTAASGIVVGVQTPEGRHVEALGFEDAGRTRPMTVDAYQRIGSVTKTFVGTIILQLVEEGRLSLDDPIATWFPKAPNADEITVRSSST